MRIRRRPQAPSPSSSSLQPSDPSTSTATRTPLNAARNEQCLEDGSSTRAPPHASSDLGRESGVARLLALPLGNAEDCAKNLGAEPGGDDVRRSVVNNGHRRMVWIKDDAGCAGGEWVAKVEGPPVRNGVAAPLILAVKDEKKNDSDGCGGGTAVKRRRGPAVLKEGSRCSRVNGRGWRCSQPTLVGYALCEHHLGKGRVRRLSCQLGSDGRGGGGGSFQLGRTEHSPTLPASTAAPMAAGDPAPPRV